MFVVCVCVCRLLPQEGSGAAAQRSAGRAGDPGLQSGEEVKRGRWMVTAVREELKKWRFRGRPRKIESEFRLLPLVCST